MKGDFSRDSFDPTKHYTGVFMQQGRILLDADWNEQTEIRQDLVTTALRDLIGPCGAPSRAAGFEIGVRKRGNRTDLTISPGRMYVEGHLCVLDERTSYSKQPYLPDPPPIGLEAGGRYLVYLDVWQRHVTHIEDPDLIEPALGGGDTTTRTKTIWQVRVARLKRARSPYPRATDALLATTGSGYSGMEGHLYRVEIHAGGAPGRATFKWSRDNGSIALPIEGFVGGRRNRVVLRPAGDLISRFHEGNTVEVSDDATELSGKPNPLVRVVQVDAIAHKMTFDRSVAFDRKRHPKVRRWDNEPVRRGIAFNVDDPVELENGIRVTFKGTNFTAADYWCFEARTGDGEVENITDAPPRGIKHDYCALAIITCARRGRRIDSVVEDRRRIFTEAAVPAAQRPSYSWTDIVLPAKTLGQLEELARWPGVSALFSGPSGTGKTLAAQILASQVKAPLYRVDLSGVVGKYIGETEKNLKEIFDSAESSRALLFFDEADALFGKRSGVRGRRDRYANSGVDDLLERLEHYAGVCILATNLASKIDTAFMRRLNAHVEFPLPDQRARLRIWKKIFPESVPVGKLDFTRLAKLKVSGGRIRNIALHAALLAAARGGPISMRDVKNATERDEAGHT